jgi:hypothetical protein
MRPADDAAVKERIVSAFAMVDRLESQPSELPRTPPLTQHLSYLSDPGHPSAKRCISGPADCLRGLLVGRSLVEFALRYCQVLIELAKPRQIAGGQLHPRRGMTAGPEEEIALLMRRWEQVKAGDGAVVLIGGEPGNREMRLAQRLTVWPRRDG